MAEACPVEYEEVLAHRLDQLYIIYTLYTKMYNSPNTLLRRSPNLPLHLCKRRFHPEGCHPLGLRHT
jgi:hypothetical protein